MSYELQVLEVCLGIWINFLLLSQVLSCYGSKNLYASTTTNYVSKWSFYNIYEDSYYCTFDISPTSPYDDDNYFLELIWISFDVKGKRENSKIVSKTLVPSWNEILSLAQ